METNDEMINKFVEEQNCKHKMYVEDGLANKKALKSLERLDETTKKFVGETQKTELFYDYLNSLSDDMPSILHIVDIDLREDLPKDLKKQNGWHIYIGQIPECDEEIIAIQFVIKDNEIFDYHCLTEEEMHNMMLCALSFYTKLSTYYKI